MNQAKGRTLVEGGPPPEQVLRGAVEGKVGADDDARRARCAHHASVEAPDLRQAMLHTTDYRLSEVFVCMSTHYLICSRAVIMASPSTKE